MSKSTKNIIAIITIFVMVICLFFTLKALIPTREKINMDNQKQINFNKDYKSLRPKRSKDKNKVESNETNEESTQDDSQTNNKDENAKENIQNNKVVPKRLNSKVNNRCNNLYYLLYFIESASIGASTVFLIYNNKKK